MERDQHPLFVFFSKELRRARLAAGLSQDALGKRIGYSAELIGKVETGDRRPTAKLATACDALFPELEDLFSRLLTEAEQDHGVYPAWFANWVDGEQRASIVRWWEPLLIPGLLQTAEYARTLFDVWQAVDGEGDTDGLVSARLARQAILDRPVPPSFWVLIDEVVLRRSVGGATVMHDQLVHLADMSERSRVTVEVVPAGVGAHVGLLGAFAVAGFADDTPGIVYLETPDAGAVSKHPGTVAKLALMYDTLRTESLGGRASRELIRRVAEEWKP